MCIHVFSISLLCINYGFAADNQKRLVGEIDAATGLYISGDKRFHVTIPITGSRNDILNAITDAFTPRGALLAVKPTENGTTYRLEITHTIGEDDRRTPFSQASATAFEWYRRLAVRSYQRPLVELNTYNFKINNKQSIASIYKQFATDTQGPRFHLFYLTDFGDELAFIWTNIPFAAESIDAEESIIDGRAVQVKNSIAMLQSLTFE